MTRVCIDGMVVPHDSSAFPRFHNHIGVLTAKAKIGQLLTLLQNDDAPQNMKVNKTEKRTNSGTETSPAVHNSYFIPSAGARRGAVKGTVAMSSLQSFDLSVNVAFEGRNGTQLTAWRKSEGNRILNLPNSPFCSTFHRQLRERRFLHQGARRSSSRGWSRIWRGGSIHWTF